MEALVYIVDDHAETLNVIHKILLSTGNGYSFSLAHDGVEAMDLINTQGPPDLLILDLLMPRKSGFDVLREISNNKERHDFPVLVITGLIDQTKLCAARMAGAHDVMIKPFVADDLVLRVEKLVANHLTVKDLKASVAYFNDNKQRLAFGGYITMSRHIEEKDGLTLTHVDRVGDMAHAIAHKMQLPQDICTTIQFAAKIHDIGKLYIDQRILLKPDVLTPEEKEIIDAHTVIGSEVLRHDPNYDGVLFEKANDIILYHHENFDGSGYPMGLKGRAIPVSARIVRVADVYDALAHKRPYKEAWSHSEVLRYISDNSGTQFDPEISSVFLSIAEEKAFLSFCPS